MSELEFTRVGDVGIQAFKKYEEMASKNEERRQAKRREQDEKRREQEENLEKKLKEIHTEEQQKKSRGKFLGSGQKFVNKCGISTNTVRPICRACGGKSTSLFLLRNQPIGNLYSSVLRLRADGYSHGS